MGSKKQRLKSWKVYAILDDSFFPRGQGLLDKFLSIIESPVDVVQLRFHDFGAPWLYRAARKMNALAMKRGIPLLVNDRPEVALELGASGVHLGKGDIPVKRARELLGEGAIIGRTIRQGDDPDSGDVRGADYLAIGPVFRTPLKPDLKAVSRAALRELCGMVTVPLVAIGGITKDNVTRITDCGIRTVAFVRYGIVGKDTTRKIRELREAMI
jgi:thiamine-phosphate diphosphorylase